MNNNFNPKLKFIDYQGKLPKENYEKLGLRYPYIVEISASYKSGINIPNRGNIDGYKNRYFGLHTQEPYSYNEKFWESIEWAKNFLKYIEKRAKHVSEQAFKNSELTQSGKEEYSGLKYIEVHPPRKKTTDESLRKFFEIYRYFIEETHRTLGENVEILMENSNCINNLGLYSTGGMKDCKCKRSSQEVDLLTINEFSESIKDHRNAYIALDIPQFLFAHCLGCSNDKRETKEELADKIRSVFKGLNENRDKIRSIHFWGRKGRTEEGGIHQGDLNYLFYCKEYSNHDDGDRQFALERVRETQTLKKMRCLLLIGTFRGENKFSCQIPQEYALGQIHLVVSGFKAQYAYPLHHGSNGTGMVRTSVYALRERRSSLLHYGAVS